jgi:hypothetical protein
MSDLKTQPTGASVDAFIDGLDSERRRDESRRLVEILRDVTGEGPEMWGEKIVGFGRYHYRYASGREGDWMRIGFAPQTRHLALYCMGGTADAHADILERLGPHRTGSGCVYVTRLDKVDEDVLRELFEASLARLAATYDG